MAQAIQPYKRSLTGSVGAGLGSLFGSSGKQYYILEHKISSKYHKVGEAQEIIVNQVELGRDPKCQVRFDDSFSTVSRQHAAIIKDGDKWKLVQLSSTNPTLLNGIKVSKEWYLQNGDEIQLSINGPKLGFIIPTGNKSTVGSIGLSRRLSLFRQQALRPYKQAITLLSIFLILAIGGLSGWKIYSDKQWAERFNTAQDTYSAEKIKQDSIMTAKFNDQEQALATERERNEIMRNSFETRLRNITAQTTPSGVIENGNIDNAAIDACLPNVYFIVAVEIEVTLPTGETQTIPGGWTGTGFLLNDGRFVTARHVAETWSYVVSGGEVNDDMLMLNKIANNGGKVVAHFAAFSSSQDNFTFTSDQFTCDRSNDELGVDEDGLSVKTASPGNSDWAYFKSGKSGGLAFDKAKSTSLNRGTNLTILGFPLTLGANAANDIQPQWSTGITAGNGLNQGVILTTNTTYEQGNSGGPVFYSDSSGKLIVIGIVSAGAGRSTGFVVPIASIK